MGIEEDVYKIAAPAEIAGRTAWYTDLGSSGRQIYSRDAWGLGQYEDEYKTHSPSRYAILPQIRLEPIISRRAMELNPKGIRYGMEVIEAENKDDHVVLRVGPSKETDAETKEILAQYVIAADGGRSMTNKLDVAWEGEKDIFHMATAHVRTPLRDLHPDARNFLTWFTHPEMGGSTKTGFLYQIGPWPWDENPAEQQEWVFACALIATDPSSFDRETMINRMRATLKIPDLAIDVISLSHWTVNAISAAKYRVGRVFLAGDAAHKIPPWGALGMNTGVQDVQNLVWKLELALREPGNYQMLLDSYDTERRPVGSSVAASSLHNLLSHSLEMDKALGMSPTASSAENADAIGPFFEPKHPDYPAKREAVRKAQKTLDTEFKAPGTEVGWFYPSADAWGEAERTRHAGQIREDGSFDTEFYHPSTLPGHHLPHAYIEKEGRKVAVRDLIPLSKLLLLAGSPRWYDVGNKLVHVEMIGQGGWTDIDGQWQKQKGVSEDGAVLVRPDGIVAWRGEWHDSRLQDWPDILSRVLSEDEPLASRVRCADYLTGFSTLVENQRTMPGR
ncbi:FAD-binding domain-containing protein 37 [Elsinoe australis]|uniref:FAD-binding domain-containing protein 37 n=1 Tax=Elsinoe australis TaxID=40998 RepID=A0A4U7AW51_9PEZI|nr:FAD-binding domain-containing protein 37 [Elsinoe australis]